MNLVQAPASVAADRFTLGLSDVDLRRVAFAATSGTDALLPVAGELLTALGKEVPPEGFHSLDCERAPIWLAAHRITDAIILRADVYPDRLLAETDDLLASLGITFWAVVDRLLQPRDRDRMRRRAQQEVSWSSFVSRWRNARRVSPSVHPEHAPILARAGAADGRLHFDQAFLHAFQMAAGWGGDTHPRREAVERRFRSLLERFDGPACQLSAAEAVKMVVAEYGWEVTLHEEAIPLPGSLDPAIACASLRTYRDPRVTAVGALWTSGLASGEIRAATLSSEPSGLPELEGSPLSLTQGLEPFVTAQVHARLQKGATPGDWLFLGERGQLSARTVESVALNWLQTIDPSAAKDDLRARRPGDGRWLQARGIDLRWMPRLDPRRPAPAMSRELARLVHDALDSHQPSPSCNCSRPHPKLAPTFPDWPPVRQHAAPARDHPWAYRARIWQARRRRADLDAQRFRGSVAVSSCHPTEFD